MKLADSTERVATIPACRIGVFCGASVGSMVSEMMQDRRMIHARFAVHAGGLAEAIQAYRSQEVPDLIIAEVGIDKDVVERELRELADLCEPGTNVVLLGPIDEIGFYRRLIKVGIREYISLPTDYSAIMGSVCEVFTRPDNVSRGRLIAVMGACGGVGTSAISQNLAWSIANKLNDSSLLLDMDLNFGTARLAFDNRSDRSILRVLRQPERIDSSILHSLLTKIGDNVSLLGGMTALGEISDYLPSTITPLVANLRQMARAVVVDLPRRWDESIQQFLLEADAVIIVAEADLANLQNARELIKWIDNKRAGERPRLVLNRIATPKRSELGLKEFGAALKIGEAISIRYTPTEFSNALDAGRTVCEEYPRSQVTKTFAALAFSVMDREIESNGSNMVLKKLKNLRALSRRST